MSQKCKQTLFGVVVIAQRNICKFKGLKHLKYLRNSVKIVNVNKTSLLNFELLGGASYNPL